MPCCRPACSFTQKVIDTHSQTETPLSSSHHLAPGLSSRQFTGVADLRAMLELLMQARSQTTDWQYAHVGELLFNFFMVACHLDPCQHIRLWQDEAGKLVGYAILGEDPSFDCQVLPEHAWGGIEEHAFTWAESRLSTLRRLDASHWSAEFVSGARQDDQRRIAFLEQHDFHYSGRFAEVNMLRSLNVPLPNLELPVGCRVCSMAELDDITDRAAAQREVWLPWTVGHVTGDDYARLMDLPGYHPDLDVVTLAPDGHIAAYVNGWIDPLNRIGDFGPVGARQEYRRHGLTRLAMLEGMQRMRSYGMERVCISTGVSNTPAFNLYASLGFQVVNRYLDFVRPD
jgi:mycothiol synthase